MKWLIAVLIVWFALLWLPAWAWGKEPKHEHNLGLGEYWDNLRFLPVKIIKLNGDKIFYAYEGLKEYRLGSVEILPETDFTAEVNVRGEFLGNREMDKPEFEREAKRKDQIWFIIYCKLCNGLIRIHKAGT